MSPSGHPSVQVCVLSSFYKDTSSMGSGTTPGTPFYLPHLSKNPSPNTVTFCPQLPTLTASASKGMTLFCHVSFDFQVFGTSAPSCSALNQPKAHIGPWNCPWWNWRSRAIMFFFCHFSSVSLGTNSRTYGFIIKHTFSFGKRVESKLFHYDSHYTFGWLAHWCKDSYLLVQLDT